MGSMTTESPWWTQGTLHQSDLEAWRIAEQNNRLATALDMLMALKEEASTRIVYESGEELMRYVIETALQLGDEHIVAEVTLADRSDMLFRMLIGRTAMSGRYVVDPSRSYCVSQAQ